MISVAEAMEFLRIESGVDLEDEVQKMLDAATAAAEDYLNGSFTGLPVIEMKPPIKAAILLQVGDLFENRERQRAEPYYQNRTYERLLNPYRVMNI